MDGTQIPPHDHPSFDAICSEVEDFEHLPAVTGAPAAPEAQDGEEERAAAIDEQILGGLISP
jgi:hypothetical protein